MCQFFLFSSRWVFAFKTSRNLYTVFLFQHSSSTSGLNPTLQMVSCFCLHVWICSFQANSQWWNHTLLWCLPLLEWSRIVCLFKLGLSSGKQLSVIYMVYPGKWCNFPKAGGQFFTFVNSVFLQCVGRRDSLSSYTCWSWPTL